MIAAEIKIVVSDKKMKFHFPNLDFSGVLKGHGLLIMHYHTAVKQDLKRHICTYKSVI